MLAVKHQAIFFANFVESVFHYNAYTGHSVYNKAPQTSKEAKLFALNGAENAEYVVVLLFSFVLCLLLFRHDDVNARCCSRILPWVRAYAPKLY